jgi:hypothetical protein
LTDKSAEHLRELAEPWPSGSSVKSAIDRASKRAGLTYWRAFDIWYGKARRIEQFERDAIADAVEAKRREATRNEFHDLKVRLARLESRLVQTDEDFHRNDVAGLGMALSAAGPRGGNRR